MIKLMLMTRTQFTLDIVILTCQSKKLMMMMKCMKNQKKSFLILSKNSRMIR